MESGKKYKARPIVVEAIQYTRGNGKYVAKFMDAINFSEKSIYVPGNKAELNVVVKEYRTNHEYNLYEGVYVIKYKGDFKFMSEDEFKDNYTPIYKNEL